MVQVGATATAEGGVFQYIPSSVTAPNGTVVTFQFSGVYVQHTSSCSWCLCCTFLVQETTPSPSRPLLIPASLLLAVLILAGFRNRPSRKQFLNSTLQSLTTANVRRRLTYDTLFWRVPVAIWFFCKQLLPSPHCQAGKLCWSVFHFLTLTSWPGMAGGINVPTSGTNTIQNFIIAAKNSTGMPGVCPLPFLIY